MLRDYSIRLVSMNTKTREESDKYITLQSDNNVKAALAAIDSLTEEEKDSIFEIHIAYFKK